MYKNKKTREKVKNRRFPAFFLFQGTLGQKTQKVGTIFATLYI